MSDTEVRSAISGAVSALGRWLAASSPARLTTTVVIASSLVIGATVLATTGGSDNSGSVVALSDVPELEVVPGRPPTSSGGEGAEIALPAEGGVITDSTPRSTESASGSPDAPTSSDPVPAAQSAPAPSARRRATAPPATEATTATPATTEPRLFVVPTVQPQTTEPSETIPPETVPPETAPPETAPPETTTTTTTTQPPTTTIAPTTTTSLPKKCIKNGRGKQPDRIDWECVRDELLDND
ncbi:MAG: hypothetical protein P8N02_13710 [Actinomycetota bacterium]|nr:hypothetical protein [Actinomycetota bacterium]